MILSWVTYCAVIYLILFIKNMCIKWKRCLQLIKCNILTILWTKNIKYWRPIQQHGSINYIRYRSGGETRVKYNVLTTVVKKIQVFWHNALCWLGKQFWCFERVQCFLSRVKQSKMCHSFWIPWPWRSRHCLTTQCQQLCTSQHGIASQTWIFKRLTPKHVTDTIQIITDLFTYDLQY